MLPAMERNRQGRRAGTPSGSGVVFAARHQRSKKASDEDRMEETTEPRAWEKPRKESLTTFRHSASINVLNKRNCRGMPQDTQPSGCAVEDAHKFTEGAKLAASEEEDEPTPLPHIQKHGKSKVLAKEDKFVMDMTAVPRKARSSLASSSRSMSSRKQLGSRLPQQQSAATTRTTLSGSSSLNIFFSQNSGKRLKLSDTEFQASKNSQVSDCSTVSDQEAEVAEALFALAGGTPSLAGVLDSKLEAQLGTDAKDVASSATLPFSTARASTSRPNPASIRTDKRGFVSSRVQDASGPFAEAPRRKWPRVVAELKEEKVPMVGVVNSTTMPSSSSSPSELVNSSAGETEPESVLQRAHSVAGEVHSFPFETSDKKVATSYPYSVPHWPHHVKEMKTRDLEGQCEQYAEAKVVKKEAQINAEMKERQPEACLVESCSIATQGNTVDNLGNHDEALTKPQLSSRSDTVYDCDGRISKLKTDLMTPSTTCKLEAVYGSGEGISSHIGVKEESVKSLNTGNGHLKLKEGTDGGKEGSNQDTGYGPLKLKEGTDGGKEGSNQESEGQDEQILSETARGLQGDIEKEQSSQHIPSLKDNDTGNSIGSSCISALSSTAASSHAPMRLAGWMGGFAQFGHYGSTAPPWAVKAPLPSSSLDTKATHPAMQLPHSAISSPVKRMKSCATHVYVAHYIHREQQVSRHSLWSAALYRATAYNLNTPHVNVVDNERPREAYSGTIQKAQSDQSGPSFGYGISQANLPRTAGSGSTHGGSVAGSISASNQPTGAGRSTETSTATASGHVMAAHAQYLQMMMQQGGLTSLPFPFNGPPGQAAQCFNAPFFPLHLMPQLPHLQPSTQQSANVLPVQMQQQGKGASMHLIGSKPIASSLMGQQKQQVQAALQLPSQSQLQPPMRSHNQASSLMATSGGKQISKSQQRTSASLSLGQQQHAISHNTLSSLGHVKGLDQSISLGSSTPAVTGNSK